MVLRGGMDGREVTSDNQSRSYQDINFKEYLHAKGSGFAYSPNLISLLSDISIGLQHESRETDALSYRQDNGMLGFRQDIMVLPNHPYNLHLYAGRADEMVRGQGGQTSRALMYNWGARANYLKRPWQTMLSYTHSETESAWVSVTDSLGTNLYYFDTLTFWNSNVSYNHYLSSGFNEQSKSVKDVFTAHISKKWETFRFLSRWNIDQHNQEGHFESLLDIPDHSETRNSQVWFNEFAAELPYNVNSLLSYRKGNNDTTYQRGDRAGGASSTTDNYNLNFTHHLYKSLITNLNNGYNITESPGGKTEQKNVNLGTNYSKLIRWGSLGAGLSGGIADTSNVGGTTILSEEHSLTDSSPILFTLNSTQLDEDTIRETIRVSVIDTFNNNMVVPLDLGTHYEVIRGAFGRIHILILKLPKELEEPWKEYRFIADYANIASDYTMRGKNWGGSARMTLFNQLLSPHVGFQQSNQQALDGFFPGALNNSTSYNAGLSSIYGNVQGDITQHWKTSGTEQETRLTGYVTASFNVTHLTGTSCTLSYENGTIEQLDATSSDRDFTQNETMYAGHVQAFTSWPEWELNGTLGVNYSLYHGFGESSTRSINSGLTWHHGKMDITMRVSYHSSESEVQANTSSSSYYTTSFVLRRKLY